MKRSNADKRSAPAIEGVESSFANCSRIVAGAGTSAGRLPDSSGVAPITAALGISDWQAGLKPADKIAALEELKARGRRVLMIGDGLNDAPALAAAHVSLSPISAVDLAQAQADAVFLGERLQPVVDALAIAHRARRLMLQNLGLAVIYNAVAVPIAIAGLVTPLIAAVAMSGSSLLVTLNAVRARLPARIEIDRAETLAQTCSRTWVSDGKIA